MTTKIAVSLPDELVEAARQAVAENRAASVSAYVADALRERERAQGLAALLDEWDREFGPPGPEATAWAKRALGIE
jgi:Arc/MetJ-type ribon-helix-helix transcriptional regulator